LKGPAPIIYVVAPEANSAITRRLRGAALSFGVTLKVVPHSRNLPSAPENNAILLMPSSMKLALSDNHESCWQRIFLLSTESAFSLDGTSRLIYTPRSSGNTQDLNIIYALFISAGINLQAEWYAAKLSGECNFAEFSALMTPWLKSLKIYSYDPISVVMKAVNTVANKLGSLNVRFFMASDGYSFDVKISVADCKIEDQKILADLLSCPVANLIFIRHDGTNFEITIKCNLAPSEVRQIKVIENTSSLGSNSAEQSEREAS